MTSNNNNISGGVTYREIFDNSEKTLPKGVPVLSFLWGLPALRIILCFVDAVCT